MIYDPNGPGARTGQEVRVHKAGCRDITRDLRGATSHYEVEVATQAEAAEDFWADFIAEESMTAEQALTYLDFLPCTNGLPES